MVLSMHCQELQHTSFDPGSHYGNPQNDIIASLGSNGFSDQCYSYPILSSVILFI